MDVPDDREASTSKPLRLKRKLTPFLCQELLYEYAVGALDPQRTADIDEYLPSDRASQDALETIRRGLDYSERLAASEISPELMARLTGSENVGSITRRYADWYEWPKTVRWSFAALALSLLISGVAAVVPWGKLPSFFKKADSNTVVLVDIPGTTVATQDSETAKGADAAADDEAQAAAEMETSGDEHITGDEPAADLPPPAVASRPTAGPAVEPSPALAATEAGGAGSAPKEVRPKGFVYRAFMNVANVGEVTSDVVQQLESFGGEKAGEVPLGWRRGAGSYFHFTVPESNENKTLEMLRTYGPVRISKDPHPRLMPAGQVRFILWIEPQAGSEGTVGGADRELPVDSDGAASGAAGELPAGSDGAAGGQ